MELLKKTLTIIFCTIVIYPLSLKNNKKNLKRKLHYRWVLSSPPGSALQRRRPTLWFSRTDTKLKREIILNKKSFLCRSLRKYRSKRSSDTYQKERYSIHSLKFQDGGHFFTSTPTWSQSSLDLF